VNSKVKDRILPELLDQSKITHFGTTLFTNPDEFSLAQSSLNPAFFGHTAGVGRALFAGASSQKDPVDAAMAQLRQLRPRLNECGVIDDIELAETIGTAVDAVNLPLWICRHL
jgi:hypothetical protein